MREANVCSDVQSAVLFDDRLSINAAVPNKRVWIEKSWKKKNILITDSVPLSVSLYY